MYLAAFFCPNLPVSRPSNESEVKIKMCFSSSDFFIVSAYFKLVCPNIDTEKIKFIKMNFFIFI